jgi:alpha-L-rhamnosidase
VPTDCPHREKGAYNGDGEVIAETSIHDFNMAAFYTKWLNDMQDSQEENGRIPNTSPTLIGGYGGGIPWGSAYILIPSWMYQYYTDTTAMSVHYTSMKKYLSYLLHLARNDSEPDEPYIINDFGGYWYSLGEWCAPGKPDGPNHPVISTAYYYLDALTLSKMARILGHNKDADSFAALADSVKQAFNNKFFNPETDLYGSDSLFQTYQIAALAFDLVPEKYRDKVLKGLIEDIEVKHKKHLHTGIIGTKYLWQVLSKNGYQDIAYTIIKQTTYPGYGYWITNGATTLWEQWDGKNSHNHQMFGTVTEFFYRYLAGINAPTDEGTTCGYDHIKINPYMPDTMRYVKASIKTIHGPVVSQWEQQNGKLFFHVEVPANSNASISIPIKKFKNINITESNKEVWANDTFISGTDGITKAVKGNDVITISVLSGCYDFVVTDTR